MGPLTDMYSEGGNGGGARLQESQKLRQEQTENMWSWAGTRSERIYRVVEGVMERTWENPDLGSLLGKSNDDVGWTSRYRAACQRPCQAPSWVNAAVCMQVEHQGSLGRRGWVVLKRCGTVASRTLTWPSNGADRHRFPRIGLARLPSRTLSPALSWHH